MTPYIITIAAGVCAGALGIFALYKAFTAPPKKTTNPTPTLFDELDERYKQTGNKAYKAAAIAIIVVSALVALTVGGIYLYALTIVKQYPIVGVIFFAQTSVTHTKKIAPNTPIFTPVCPLFSVVG